VNDPNVSPAAITELIAGDNPTGLKDDVSVAQAAKIYRSHDPSQVSPPHRISFEDEPAEKRPPQPSHQTEHHPEPESRQLDLGINKPLRNAFFVSLGWAAGQFLSRILILLFLFAVIGVGLLRFINGL
jgi:hypothetical protein